MGTIPMDERTFSAKVLGMVLWGNGAMVVAVTGWSDLVPWPLRVSCATDIEQD